jgi:general stress protein CsbA
MPSRAKSVLHEIFPFLLIFLVQVLFHSQWVVLVITLAAIFYTMRKPFPREWLLLLIGFILGLAVEIGLGLINRQQMWSETFIGGVPVWLPFIWAYGFVVIRRIGNLIVR